jgi:hypothetical protein
MDSAISFDNSNSGLQIGVNNAPITADFHLPSSKLPLYHAEQIVLTVFWTSMTSCPWCMGLPLTHTQTSMMMNVFQAREQISSIKSENGLSPHEENASFG